MSETIIVKTMGGPVDGETRMVDRDVVGWPWPPPDRIRVPGHKGFYMRETYSQLSEISHPNVMRGAQYQWIEE